MGVCNIFADALAMGVGEYLSTKSSNEFALFERKREAWELENNFDGEVAEMVDIYVKRGMSKDDATAIVERMAKYPSLFVDIMMVRAALR
jgi:DNA damage-binding protein 1